MSNTLKDAASSTLHTVSNLVDDAQARLEHLPLLHRTTPWWRSKWAIGAAVAVAVLALGSVLRRRGARNRAAVPTMTHTPDGDAEAKAKSQLVDYDMVRS
jgi:anti-sigma-K factor RskA